MKYSRCDYCKEETQDYLGLITTNLPGFSTKDLCQECLSKVTSVLKEFFDENEKVCFSGKDCFEASIVWDKNDEAINKLANAIGIQQKICNVLIAMNPSNIEAATIRREEIRLRDLKIEFIERLHKKYGNARCTEN